MNTIHGDAIKMALSKLRTRRFIRRTALVTAGLLIVIGSASVVASRTASKRAYENGFRRGYQIELQVRYVGTPRQVSAEADSACFLSGVQFPFKNSVSWIHGCNTGIMVAAAQIARLP